MKKKLFTHGITFFTTSEMHQTIRKVTDALDVGVSEFLRGLIEDYLRKNPLKSDTEVSDNENPDRPGYPLEDLPRDATKAHQV